MSVQAIDPLDEYSSTIALITSYPNVTAPSGTVFFSLVAGRFGGKALRCTMGANSVIDYAFSSSISTVVVNTPFLATFSPATLTGKMPIVEVVDGSTVQLTVAVDNVGTLYILRGNHAGTVIATSTNRINSGAWYHLEFKATIHPSAGVVQLKIEESDTGWVPSTSGLNTRNSANSTCDHFRATTPSGIGSASVDLDHILVMDTAGPVMNDFQGDCRMDFLQPDGAGDSTQWTPTSAPNYDRVNDSPPNDAVYVGDNVVGHRDTYTCADTTGATVLYVASLTRAFKSDAGAVSMKRVLTSGGATNVETTAFAPSSTPLYYLKEYLTDPNTGVGFTKAGVNALKPGYEIA